MRLQLALSWLTAAIAVVALAGCGSSLGSLTADQQPTVSLTPTATGTCSLQVSTAPYDLNGSPDTTPTYTVTLTDTSTVPDDVSQISTVFYDSNSRETGSDQRLASGIIAPGQSLTWSFNLPDNQIGTPVQTGTITSANDGGAYWNDGDPLGVISTIPQSCQFEQWG